LVLSLLSAVSAYGCALTSKSEPLVPRYFSPELPEHPIRPGGSPSPSATAELRLGHVNGASYLDTRLMYRDSASELGYYSERRWTESPDEYLSRRLAQVLFEQRGIRRVVSGIATTLEVELTAFEEVRAPKRLARAQVVVRLQTQRLVRWEETLTAEEPLETKGRGDVETELVDGLGLALRLLVDRIADRVGSELADEAAAPKSTTSALARAPCTSP
jgi:cholesterol transport system auxiliary component